MPKASTREFWCICRKYCKGRRRQLYTANTWRRHLREADEGEKDAIRLARFSDAFRAFLNAASSSKSGTSQAQPEAPILPGIGIKRCGESFNDRDHDLRPSSAQRSRRGSSSQSNDKQPLASLPEPVAQVGAAVVTPQTNDQKPSWRPPSNKTGRTLCAHRWLKQVNPSGSKDEFDAYYQTLNFVTKARYKDEAAKLVTDGIWTKGSADVIAKIAVLLMH